MIERNQTPIFGALAPRYYAAGVPVIPLHYHDKKPIPKNWQQFHDHLPDTETQKNWVEQFSNCNIGVVLGKQSGLMIMDIDTTDVRLMDVLMKILPPSPWRRVGQKGCALAYRYNGVKTFRIRDTAGNTIVECLSDRTQLVLPPSIHPTTQRPYEANVDLLEVIDRLPILDAQIEALLRGRLKEEGVDLSHSGWTRVTDWVSKGSRDNQMTSVAGIMSQAIVRGEITVKEGIDRLHAWCSTFVENVPGDPLDPQKGVKNMLTFLTRDVLEKKRQLPLGWDEGLSPEEKAELDKIFTVDHVEWSFDQLKEYLRGEFERHQEEGQGRTNAINVALTKIANSGSLNVLEEDRIIRYIAYTGGSNLTVSGLRARLKELRQGEMKGTDQTEIAKALLKDLEQFGQVRYYGDRFWQWRGSNWTMLDRADIFRTIADNYGSLAAAKKANDHSGIFKILSTLVDRTLRTNDLFGINFANGFLTRDLEILDHHPDLGMTYTLPFRYLPELAGKFPKFDTFLHRCWGEDEDYQEKVSALQEMICVTLFGMGPSFQRACLLFGAPATGKSQLLEIIRSVVPDEARATVRPEDWHDKFAPTMLLDKLLNVCGELSEVRRIDGRAFKDIVDGQEINGQYKGGQLFLFKPVATHWFASNHLPKTDDTSDAFNRRWLVLEFKHPVKPDERINDLGQIIAAEEREAIVAWAVEAMPRLMKRNTFTLPESHKQIMKEVATNNNSVRFFIEESGMVRIARGEKTSPRTLEATLHSKYYSFCLGVGGAKPATPRVFRSRMRELASEKGFRMLISNLDNGTQVCEYENVILVDGQAM